MGISLGGLLTGLSSGAAGYMQGKRQRRHDDREDARQDAETQRAIAADAMRQQLQALQLEQAQHEQGRRGVTEQQAAEEARMRLELLRSQTAENQAQAARQSRGPEAPWAAAGFPDAASYLAFKRRESQATRAPKDGQEPEWRREGYPDFATWRRDKLAGKSGSTGSGGGGAVTEGERRAAGMIPRVEASGKQLDGFQAPNAVSRQLSRLPIVGNLFAGKDQQVYDQASKEFVTGVLRPESGATITPSEMEQYSEMYAPQPFDSDEVLEQKRQARARAIEQTRSMAGRAAPGVAPAAVDELDSAADTLIQRYSR